MSGAFFSVEFLGSDGRTQAKKCRQMADEAGALLAGATDPELRACYLDLKRQWAMLADEIEQLARSNAITS
jgi:hypothetical protein